METLSFVLIDIAALDTAFERFPEELKLEIFTEFSAVSETLVDCIERFSISIDFALIFVIEVNGVLVLMRTFFVESL